MTSPPKSLTRTLVRKYETMICTETPLSLTLPKDYMIMTASIKSQVIKGSHAIQTIFQLWALVTVSVLENETKLEELKFIAFFDDMDMTPYEKENTLEYMFTTAMESRGIYFNYHIFKILPLKVENEKNNNDKEVVQ